MRLAPLVASASFAWASLANAPARADDGGSPLASPAFSGAAAGASLGLGAYVAAVPGDRPVWGDGLALGLGAGAGVVGGLVAGLGAVAAGSGPETTTALTIANLTGFGVNALVLLPTHLLVPPPEPVRRGTSLAAALLPYAVAANILAIERSREGDASLLPWASGFDWGFASAGIAYLALLPAEPGGLSYGDPTALGLGLGVGAAVGSLAALGATASPRAGRSLVVAGTSAFVGTTLGAIITPAFSPQSDDARLIVSLALPLVSAAVFGGFFALAEAVSPSSG